MGGAHGDSFLLGGGGDGGHDVRVLDVHEGLERLAHRRVRVLSRDPQRRGAQQRVQVGVEVVEDVAAHR